MKGATIGLAVVVAMAVLAPAAWADWDPEMPAKYWQLPDLSPTGMDVNATWKGPNEFPDRSVLADDFECTSPGPITDIHIWGSWLNDMVNPNVTFKLSIHADIPALPDGTAGYSHPGAPLWQQMFLPGQYNERPYAPATEQFFEPNRNEIIGFDTQVFQYNFYIPKEQAFFQEGTATNVMVYWLDVIAILPAGSVEVFGWKTSLEHWNDDAVFGLTPDPFAPVEVWNKLVYPPGHPMEGQSIDLAFVITPEPATMCLLGLGAFSLVARRRNKK